jgi:hypothetical protein
VSRRLNRLVILGKDGIEALLSDCPVAIRWQRYCICFSHHIASVVAVAADFLLNSDAADDATLPVRLLPASAYEEGNAGGDEHQDAGAYESRESDGHW